MAYCHEVEVEIISLVHGPIMSVSISIELPGIATHDRIYAEVRRQAQGYWRNIVASGGKRFDPEEWEVAYAIIGIYEC